MELKRCPNGHFYDASKFTTCPHCQNAGANAGLNDTVSLRANADGTDSPTISAPGGTEPPTTPKPPEPPEPPKPPIDDVRDGMTQGYFNDAKEFEADPVVGWLVCTVGKHIGCDYRLKTGRNFIGRSAVNDIALEGETTVSRESHAIVAYEPRQNIFIAQPGSASELFYVNDDVVLSAVVLKRNDRLQIGEAELMLIPCCDENFQWKKSEKNDE